MALMGDPVSNIQDRKDKGIYPPPSAVSPRYSSKAWPPEYGSDQEDQEKEDLEDEGEGTSYFSSKCRGGYTFVPAGGEVEGPVERTASRERESYDGVGRDDFPVMERKGCSVLADSREAWVQDVEQLYSFVLSERPILPPSISLRFTFHRGPLTPEDGDLMELPFDQKSTELFSFTVPVHLPAQSINVNTRGGQILIDVNASVSNNMSKSIIDTTRSQIVTEFDALPPGSQLRAVQDTVPCYRSAPWLKGALKYSGARQSHNARTIESTDASVGIRALLASGRASGAMDIETGLPIVQPAAHAAAAQIEDAAANGNGRGAGRRLANVKAPKKIIEEWNATRAKGLREPWRGPPLRPSRDGSSCDDDAHLPSSTDGFLEDPPKIRSALYRSLSDFIREEAHLASAKIMLFEHLPYGWDLDALSKSVQTLINTANAPGTVPPTSAAPLHPRIARVRITYERIPPWLDLQVRHTREWLPFWGGGLPVNAGVSLAGAQSWVMACFAAAFAGGIFALVSFGSSSPSWHGNSPSPGAPSQMASSAGNINATLAWTALLLAIVSGAIGVYTMIQIAHVRASDTILMAHALKSWRHTGLPASYSRNEVVREMQERHASAVDARSAGDERGNIAPLTLARRPDGWYVLAAGLREGDWLGAHKDWLLEAVRLKKSGDLSADFLENSRDGPGAFERADEQLAQMTEVREDTWTGL
ncbi:hypothetical protein K437DRAFT_80167 [Tilletiaria anomala UBC 951]|uniref:Uncharacterized protein n=1 Tax=Tilletiaria anomala (strain ATCC 24038 / CBS 436.72 / UBC 951) TaxID=1037660 RepID=A0A066W5J8_TILAU|nr:uncharacterized protein K437DRAFT_80167 [Tilletiaria anomala UBC 951]KDN49242.1 hypothetical protein K437DRAFT_80167 [Tilletiaria anomala UBC 951]